MMDPALKKISRIDELAESGADPEIIASFVIKLENDFLKRATSDSQAGQYALAVRHYFLALLLPHRSAPREEIFARALRAYLQLKSDKNGSEEKELNLPQFAPLKAEMLQRVEAEKRKDLDVRFAELDGRASLRGKNFAALEKILGEMGESMQTRYLVAQLRLSREKKAQQFFEQIITRFRGLAEEEDFSNLRAQLDGEIDTLRKKAVIFSTGIHPIYGDQIREYMRRAEELFAKSHTETVIDAFHKEESKLLNEEFIEFKGNIKPDVAPIEILRAIVKALRIFRDQELFGEVQRISAEWARTEAELRYRLLAIDQVEEAFSLVIRSITLIDEHQAILPVEISIELKAFLIRLRDELTVREIPVIRPEIPTPQAVPRLSWFARLIAWLRSWFTGRQFVKSVLVLAVQLWLIGLCCSMDVRAQADVVLAVDMSGTMETNDPQHLRYYGADQFLSMLSYYGVSRNRGGVIKFGNSADELLPFNYVSHDQAGKYQNLFANLKSEEWTELGKGLELSAKLLSGDKGRHRSVILISDGQIEGDPNARHMSQSEAKTQAEQELWGVIVPELRRMAVKVYTIGLFSSDTRGKPLLQRLALETGGSYEQVLDPRQFYTIYKAMLDNIEPPAGVASIKGENKRFPLTPADHGVIITGRGDFSVRAPNGTIYPNHDDPSVSGVDHRFLKYPDGGSVLFLGQPSTGEQRMSPNWTGEWLVDLQGEGEATFLSSVRFVRADVSIQRPGFFKNEYIPINYVLELGQDMDKQTKSFLDECRAEYTMVRTDQTTGWAKSGKLVREDRLFRANQLVDQPGTLLLEVQMFCREVRYRKVNERLNVFDADLLNLSVWHGANQLLSQGEDLGTGDAIRIEGNLNLAEISKSFPDFKGVKDQALDLELTYNSNPVQKVGVGVEPNGRLISSEREVQESGALNIEGVFRGVLVAKSPALEGMIYFPITVKAARKVHVERTVWGVLGAALERIRWWIVDVILPGGTVVAFFFGFVRRKQTLDVSSMKLEGSMGLSRPFEDVELSFMEKIKRALVLRGGPHVTIGGPASGADVGLTSGGGALFAEIGKDIFNNFYIQPLGETQVCLNSKSNPVEQNARTPLQPNDEIFIEGIEPITFKRTFEEAGV